MTIKVILCDSNIIYGLYTRYISNNFQLPSSVIRNVIMKGIYDIYLGTYTIDELEEVFIRKQIIRDVTTFYTFTEYVGFKVLQSRKSKDTQLIPYIYDQDDLFILQDAIDIQADLLLTKNLKDFNIPAIKKDFHITVADSIPEEFF